MAAGVALLLLTMGASLAAAAGETAGLSLRLEIVAEGFEAPVFLTGSGDGSGDRLVAEQGGRIRLLRADGTVAPDPVVDISDRVLHHAERGLLGLAIHPRFPENGSAFVLYSRRDDGATVLSRVTLPGSVAGTLAGPSQDAPRPQTPELQLLVIPQRYTTHKGGMLAFDGEGMLLAGIGDGGSGNDPQRHGLDRRSLLGKLLRLDVERGAPYAIPPDNGFATDPTARGEIHAIGLRNPWRFSVDRVTGDIYIGDVGQSGWEEVDVLPSGRQGASFGWSDMEGPDCLADRACDPAAHLAPAIAYRHDDASRPCAVIGGFAYRGARGTLPSGAYVFGDHCSGLIWAVPAEDLLASGRAAPHEAGRVDPAFGQLVSFGEDDDGELYAVTDAGLVLRLVDASRRS
jgi:glucose/arabinose dehydrogenase